MELSETIVSDGFSRIPSLLSRIELYDSVPNAETDMSIHFRAHGIISRIIYIILIERMNIPLLSIC